MLFSQNILEICGMSTRNLREERIYSNTENCTTKGKNKYKREDQLVLNIKKRAASTDNKVLNIKQCTVKPGTSDFATSCIKNVVCCCATCHCTNSYSYHRMTF